MKMVLCIVHRDDADGVVQALSAAGFQTTRMASTGGFLREGNYTLVSAIEAPRLEEFLQLVRDNVQQHLLMPTLSRPEPTVMSGATVFVLDVEQAEKC